MPHNFSTEIRGIIKLDFCLKNMTFFKVGGKCDIFFEPYDIKDLCCFLRNKPKSIGQIICLGSMSNVLISDRGFRGCIISLKNLKKIEFKSDENTVYVQAGASINNFIKACIDIEKSCCEDMYCIPGTLGGAIFMNAGVPNFEISDTLISVECVDKNGNIITLKKNDINFEYRKSNISDDLIITSCVLQTKNSDKTSLLKKTNEIRLKRTKTQPIGAATCGSTFKNPDGFKAWQLIESSGCKDLKIGGATVSNIHCNFIVNNGGATANDILSLVNTIKDRVLKSHNIILEEEIKFIGEM